MIASCFVFACAVCFGSSQANSSLASTLFVLALVGITMMVLGAFAIFAVYLSRKEKQAAGDVPGPEALDSEEEPYPTPRWEWKSDASESNAGSASSKRSELRHGHPHSTLRRFTFPE